MRSALPGPARDVRAIDLSLPCATGIAVSRVSLLSTP